MNERVPTYREQEERRRPLSKISGAGARVPPASMLGAVCGPPPTLSGRKQAEGAEDRPPSSISVSVGSGHFRRLNTRVPPDVAAGGCSISTGTGVAILWIRRERSSSHSGRASFGAMVSRPEVPRTSSNHNY